MLYEDAIYGTQTIDEPLLLELMASQAMQRLGYVLQHGITGLLGITARTTRFEHSLGVMLLVRCMGASLEEQAAALLHDVSHTAFSHVIDYVFNSHTTQGFHEDKKAEYLAASDIPAILAKYGFDWQRLLQEENYSLLEQPSPRLCADRLDYFLRDSRMLGISSQADIARVLSDLVVVDGRIVCRDLEIARWCGNAFIRADDASWSNFREVGLYELAAIAIRTAMNKGILTEADLWTGDEQAWTKMAGSPDSELQAQLRLVSTQTELTWDEAEPDFWVSTKIRTIDPDVLVDGAVKPLSELDKNFAQHRKNYIARKSGKWPVRIIR